MMHISPWHSGHKRGLFDELSDEVGPAFLDSSDNGGATREVLLNGSAVSESFLTL